MYLNDYKTHCPGLARSRKGQRGGNQHKVRHEIWLEGHGLGQPGLQGDAHGRERSSPFCAG